MILYIHGFRTTPNSYKALKLQEHFKDKIIISNHSHEPLLAIKDLEKIIENNNITSIIASSIGGYYATYISEKYNLKTVLINPSVKPFETTTKYLGVVTKQNGETFIWEEKHLKELKQLQIDNLTKENYFVFLQRADEVLDYKVARERYQECNMVIELGGNHRFDRFERYYLVVEDFLKV